MSGLAPLPPPRVASQQKVTFQGPQTWRESIGAFVLTCLAISVFISALVTAYYVFRNRSVYEELIDYMDKTVSISKINFNPHLGEYRISKKELEVLDDQRTYKTATLIMLLSDCGCYVFISLALLLFLCADISGGATRAIYWVFVFAALLYAVVQIHACVFFIYPYSSALPNQTELLLNHAIPYNPGGLQQMEQVFDCTFALDLYAAFKRRLNPKNTCDPYMEASFMPAWLLFAVGGARLLPVVLFALLAARRTAVSGCLAERMERLRPSSLTAKRRQHACHDAGKAKTTTTFASQGHVAMKPPGSVDHTINYDNTVMMATSGAFAYTNAHCTASSRSSEISRIDALDLSRAAHHNSASLMSEV